FQLRPQEELAIGADPHTLGLGGDRHAQVLAAASCEVPNPDLCPTENGDQRSVRKERRVLNPLSGRPQQRPRERLGLTPFLFAPVVTRATTFAHPPQGCGAPGGTASTNDQQVSFLPRLLSQHDSLWVNACQGRLREERSLSPAFLPGRLPGHDPIV